MSAMEREYQQAIEMMRHLRRRVAELEQENGRLRHELSDLRRGVGITVQIQGRTVPVTVQPAELPAPLGAAPLLAPPAVNNVPVSQPSHGVFAVRPANSQPAPRSWPTDDDAWLTGPMPAITAQTNAVRTPPLGLPRGARPSPSQRVTPTWLRDETAQPQPHSFSPEQQRMTPSMPIWAQEPAPRQQPRARPLGRPSTPRLEPFELDSTGRMPTLAQITGQHPAIRPQRERNQQRNGSNPLSDSFLLG